MKMIDRMWEVNADWNKLTDRNVQNKRTQGTFITVSMWPDIYTVENHRWGHSIRREIPSYIHPHPQFVLSTLLCALRVYCERFQQNSESTLSWKCWQLTRVNLQYTTASTLIGSLEEKKMGQPFEERLTRCRGVLKTKERFLRGSQTEMKSRHEVVLDEEYFS